MTGASLAKRPAASAGVSGPQAAPEGLAVGLAVAGSGGILRAYRRINPSERAARPFPARRSPILGRPGGTPRFAQHLGGIQGLCNLRGEKAIDPGGITDRLIGQPVCRLVSFQGILKGTPSGETCWGCSRSARGGLAFDLGFDWRIRREFGLGIRSANQWRRVEYEEHESCISKCLHPH